jgi:nucleotide-binding universal stress UspA family protein
MNKIVVGYDGGDEARDALHLGCALARQTHADLIVACALPTALEFETTIAAHFAAVFDKARAEIPSRDFAMRELRDVSAPAGLADIAATEEAEMIVIGSTHRGVLGRAFPGSVGERLMSRAQCPVMVAPRGFARHQHYGIGLVGIALDGGEEAQVALLMAAELARRLDAGLRVVTILPPAEVNERNGSNTMETVLQDRGKEIQLRARQELDPSIETEFVIESGDPSASLARHGVDLDLLVIGSRGYGPVRRAVLGAVSAEVMRTAPCPVLVVPRTAVRHHDVAAR